MEDTAVVGTTLIYDPEYLNSVAVVFILRLTDPIKPLRKERYQSHQDNEIPSKLKLSSRQISDPSQNQFRVAPLIFRPMAVEKKMTIGQKLLR